MTKIKCDKCNEVFELKVKVKKYVGSVQETYFKCPNCKERYSSYFTDENIKAKQKAINVLWKEYNLTKSDETLGKITNLKAEILSDMAALKSKMTK